MSEQPYLSPALRTNAEEFFRWVEAARDIAIGTHVNPDGDALGSALAMSHWLERKQIQHEVLCAHPPPENLAFLPGASRVRTKPRRIDHDLGIVLDLEALRRLGSVDQVMRDIPRLVVIDHHVPDEAPGDLRIVEVGAPATAAILCDLFLYHNETITAEMATCLLTGIMTDTGSFRFQNTTAHSMRLAAHLVELGAELSVIATEVYQRKSLAATRLLAHVLETMRLECEDHVAIGTIPFDAYRQAGATDEHSEGIVNELLSIRTVEVAALVREHQPGRIRASLRSRGGCDVAAAARKFNGGGHRAAAGVSFEGSIHLATERILEALEECLGSC